MRHRIMCTPPRLPGPHMVAPLRVGCTPCVPPSQGQPQLEEVLDQLQVGPHPHTHPPYYAPHYAPQHASHASPHARPTVGCPQGRGFLGEEGSGG